MLYAIIRSLQSIHNEYQFSLDYFVKLFDEAVGGELPVEFGHGLVTEEVLNLYKCFDQLTGNLFTGMLNNEMKKNLEIC